MTGFCYRVDRKSPSFSFKGSMFTAEFRANFIPHLVVIEIALVN